MKAIRAKCLDCSGGSEEARKCVAIRCPPLALPHGRQPAAPAYRRLDVPANLQIGDAVAAHKVALDLYAKSADPDHDRRAIANTMRAVVLVVVRTADEAQQQIDCAMGMPLEAWDKVADSDPAEVRAATLAMLERQKRDRSHAA